MFQKKLKNLPLLVVSRKKKKRLLAVFTEWMSDLHSFTSHNVSHTHTWQMSAVVRIGLPRFWYADFISVHVFFFFNGGKNVLFKGCSCILSSSKLIGLESVLAQSPGLIGIKHKHMEWQRSHCWVNHRYKIPANVITLGKGVFLRVCPCSWAPVCTRAEISPFQTRSVETSN